MREAAIGTRTIEIFPDLPEREGDHENVRVRMRTHREGGRWGEAGRERQRQRAIQLWKVF